LGLANVLVVGILITIDANELALLVWMLGGVPGVITGALLGLVAHWTRAMPAFARGCLLTAPAVLAVFALASIFRGIDFMTLDILAPIACFPTVAAAALLERWTRKAQSSPEPAAPPETVEPQLPAARVVRSGF
jgi:hypothetical protein